MKRKFVSSFVISFLLICVIPLHVLKSQTDSVEIFPQMIIMNTGDVYFGKIIKEDKSFLLFKEISGKQIQLNKSDTVSVSKDWKNIAGTILQITLFDGTVVSGKIQDYNNDNFFIVNASGIEMKIPGEKIESFKTVNANKKPELKNDPFRTVLFLAPTARSLHAGEVYFSDYMVFFPMVGIGINDFTSIGAGVSLMPGANYQLLYGSLKLAYPVTDLVSVGTGLYYTHLNNFSQSILYGVTTVGTDKYSLTLGIMDGFGKEIQLSNNTVVVVGGELELGKSLKIISENWIPSGGSSAIISLGLRFFGKHLAANFALITSSEFFNNTTGFHFIPWISFTYDFGNF